MFREERDERLVVIHVVSRNRTEFTVRIYEGIGLRLTLRKVFRNGMGSGKKVLNYSSDYTIGQTGLPQRREREEGQPTNTKEKEGKEGHVKVRKRLLGFKGLPKPLTKVLPTYLQVISATGF